MLYGRKLKSSGGSRKNIWGPGPSSFGMQQRLRESTIEPIKNLGGLGKIGGCASGPSLKPPLLKRVHNVI